jgi:hypothetical protein
MLVWAGSLAQQYKFDVPRQLRCTAYPACGKPGARCKGVSKIYSGAAAGTAKNSIVQECVKANRPDRCGNCIQQCREVSRCEKVSAAEGAAEQHVLKDGFASCNEHPLSHCKALFL